MSEPMHFHAHARLVESSNTSATLQQECEVGHNEFLPWDTNCRQNTIEL